MPGNLITIGNGFKQFGGRVLGMGGHEADEKISGDGLELPEQVRESDTVVFAFPIRIHVLSEQRNLLVPLPYQIFRLRHYGLGGTGAFSPPYMGTMQ